MRQLLNACLEKSNLPANLQSGETADRRLPASKLFNHGAKQAARERGSEQWRRETLRDSPKWRACPNSKA